MCGIAGILTFGTDVRIAEYATGMANALAHRGPDDRQVQVFDNLAMVHTRLAIQDVSVLGRQPMASQSGRFVIVFNGEIYNFHRLRKDLQDSGHHFNGGSDTEVMLAAFEQYGLAAALEKFEGMFAFALWDRTQNQLHLCRDRLGEKPLFYAWGENCFLWASELKALKALPIWTPTIDEASARSYLQYGYVPSPRSIFSNCFKLEAGAILSLPLDGLANIAGFSPYLDDPSARISPHSYWRLSDYTATSNRIKHLDYRQATDKLDNILQAVIADQMVSDVPIGAFLSGGIDSSLVASIMQSLSSAPINTFTIGFKEKDYNEAEFAKKIAAHIGSDHHELYISADECLDLVERIPSIMDEPFADSSLLPAYFVSAMAKQSVTVCLSGDGGDEIFCGYNRYLQTQQIWDRVDKVPMALRHTVAALILKFPPAFYDRVYRLATFFLASDASNTRVGLKAQKLAALLRQNSLAEVYDELISYCKARDDLFIDKGRTISLLDAPAYSRTHEVGNFMERAMALDTLTYLPNDNLTKVDRTSMAVSLETRLPLLNHRVVEFAWQLPIEAKVANGVSKRILRDVLYKRVPATLIDRPKMGFSVPIADWLRGPLHEWAQSLLLDDSNLSHGLLKSANLSRLWREHTDGKRDNSAALWAVLMLQAWHCKSF